MAAVRGARQGCLCEGNNLMKHCSQAVLHCCAINIIPVSSMTPDEYTDISDAVTVAKAIKNTTGGAPITLNQLATALGGASIKSGAFRTKLATAGTFGAVKAGRGSMELTDLGHRLADDHSRKAALVESFLRVPLYRELYDQYQNVALPGDAGPETAIHHAGVVESQADRARRAFMRSADKAGFFWGGRSRLVMPHVGAVPDDQETAEEQAPFTPSDGNNDTGSVMSSPLLSALFKKMLPADGQSFSAKERRRFFRALAVNLDVIYGEPEDGELDAEALAALFKETPAHN